MGVNGSIPRRRGATYTSSTTRRQRGRAVVWLVSLAALLTTVTIASIPARKEASSNPDMEFPVTPPLHKLDIAGANGPPSAYLPEAEEVDVALAAPGNQSPPAVSPAQAWKRLTVRKGDTLSHLLKRHGLNDEGLISVIHTNPQARTLYRLYPGQAIKIRTDAAGSVEELEYEVNETDILHIRRGGEGYEVMNESREFETRLAHVTGVIESSLFDAGQEAGLSDAMIMELVEIFGWDIDFALDLRQGDTFSAIYEEKYWLGQKIANGQILAAEFVNQGKSFRAIAYRHNTGFTAYYTPDGMSMQQEFLRTPVKFSRISSRFSTGRYHPILKTWRKHTGVDYAAPTGTPARATAAGRILSLGWKGGYGKTIVIKHGGNYSTLYAHLSGFNHSIRSGSYVEQGQIIGYVGKTGLATGPHLHYEFQVNGKHRNPLTFKFPRAKSIQTEYAREFLESAQTWQVRLDLIGRHTLALK